MGAHISQLLMGSERLCAGTKLSCSCHLSWPRVFLVENHILIICVKKWRCAHLSATYLWLTELRNSSQPPTGEHNVFLEAVIDRCRKEHQQFLTGGATQCSDAPALFCLLGWSDGWRPSKGFPYSNDPAFLHVTLWEILQAVPVDCLYSLLTGTDVQMCPLTISSHSVCDTWLQDHVVSKQYLFDCICLLKLTSGMPGAGKSTCIHLSRRFFHGLRPSGWVFYILMI